MRGALSNPDVKDFRIVEQDISVQAHSGSVIWVFQTNKSLVQHEKAATFLTY